MSSWFNCFKTKKTEQIVEDIKDDVEELVENIKDDVGEIVEDIKDDVEELVEDIKEDVEDIIDEYIDEVKENAEDIIEEKLEEFVEENVGNFVNETLENLVDSRNLENDLDFPSLEFTSYPEKDTPTDPEQISIEINEDVENKDIIKEVVEEFTENVIDEGTERAMEINNDIYESLDKLTIDSDDDTLDSDTDTVDNNINISVTTVRCDCCQDLIFYNKYEKTCPNRCVNCQLKYMN